jgi:putative modified peptide
MSDSVLTIEQASRLVRELENNEAFRQRYQDKPAAAMLEIGIPATTIANLPAACLARCTLDLKEVANTLRTLEKSVTVTAQSMSIPTVKLSNS